MALRMKQHLFAVSQELRYEPVAPRLRAYVGDQPVLDSLGAMVVWEPRRIVPEYAVPVADLAGTAEPIDPQPPLPDPATLPRLMGPFDFHLHTASGTAVDLLVGGRRLAGAGYLPDDDDLTGMVVLDFTAFDAWRAEDELLVAHPHDPFKRIDVLLSERLVEISLDGTVLASSHRAKALLETHLPARWYLPREDVRTDLLVASETTSACAYKGVASYLSTADGSEAGRDLAWFYREPLDDAVRVRDHVCFWNERTDITLDGVPQPRPITPWSPQEEQDAAALDDLEFG